MSETRWAIYCTETKTFWDADATAVTFDTEGDANRSLSYFDASEKEGCQVIQVAVPVEAATAPDDSADWPWWWISWDDEDGVKVLAPSVPTKRQHGYQVHNGKIWSATLRTQYPTKPTDEEAIRMIEEACGIELPKPEVAQWWKWVIDKDDEGWGFWSDYYGHNVHLSLTWLTVYGTTADRDEKRDALIAAAKAAGKPEVES